MDDTKRYAVNLNESLHRKFKILAGVKGVKIQGLIDEAAKMYLKKEYESTILEILEKEDNYER